MNQSTFPQLHLYPNLFALAQSTFVTCLLLLVNMNMIFESLKKRVSVGLPLRVPLRPPLVLSFATLRPGKGFVRVSSHVPSCRTSVRPPGQTDVLLARPQRSVSPAGKSRLPLGRGTGGPIPVVCWRRDCFYQTQVETRRGVGSGQFSHTSCYMPGYPTMHRKNQCTNDGH